jgi:phosphosulfolactate synthase (CoM biosynthesis protein A)
MMVKAEKDMKMKKHQEQMFLNDLKKVENKQMAKGQAELIFDSEMKLMEDRMQKHLAKMSASENHRKKEVENVKKSLESKKNIWEARRKRQEHKGLTLDTKDYKSYIPKKRQQDVIEYANTPVS